MKRITISLLFLLAIFTIHCQTVQDPGTFLGYKLGTQFTPHHRVMDYFNELGKSGNGMIKIEQYGKTNENRPLIVAYISSPENLSRLEEIRSNHEKGKDEKTAIIWLSYNVHGNESSGTETSMLTAYELINSKTDWLKDALVIIDPCLNPDGRDRYVNWYNQKCNTPFDPELISAEHHEEWPSGRSNHYYFDLNRDWAWLTQVESEQRIALYNKWLPHVHVDFHEQDPNSPYYFAPAAEPYHEVITKFQREFQTEIGKNNAAHFDKNGWFYFTREIFDLLYPSYGDTYPTFTGAVGMTYEQGGSGRAGLGIITDEGDTLTLIDRIAHHHTSGLSTVEHAVKNRDRLISSYTIFVDNKHYKYKTFIVGGNSERIDLLRTLLDKHKIEYTFGDGSTVKGYDYQSRKPGTLKTDNNSLFISTTQKKGTLVNVLFEPSTKLSDSLTYDITAWSLPYAYGLNCIATEQILKGSSQAQTMANIPPKSDVYAYLIRWESVKDARFLSELLRNDIRVRYSEQAFSFGDKHYQPGTLIIVRGENNSIIVDDIMKNANSEFGISVETTQTGMVDTGHDFGSSSVKLIDAKRIAMVSGENSSSLNVGEVWHFFEKELKYPLITISEDYISSQSLEDIDVLIVPEGYYSSLNGTVQSWVKNGGRVIAIGDALSMFTEENGYSLQSVEHKNGDEKKEDKHEHTHVAWTAQEREAVKNMITGAIYQCKVEKSNPLAFGYDDTYFTLKLSANAYKWLTKGGNVVYLEKDAKPIAGFAGSLANPKQSETLILGTESMGQGSIVYMVDNPLFRGFWENGKLFFANALFFE